jgi:hypothetical protein
MRADRFYDDPPIFAEFSETGNMVPRIPASS